MLSHYRNRSNLFQILLIVWLICASSIVVGQNPQYPSVPIPEPASSPYQPPALRKSRFEHANAADALRILQQLTGEYSTGVAVDERTNTLIYLADEEDARELEELCKMLDTETPATSVAGSGIRLSVPAMGPKPLAFDFSIGLLRGGESIGTLKQRYDELEHQTHQLADKLKQSTSLSEAQRTELQLAVRKSFEARQTLQRAELADFADRMKSMQQAIDMRDKLAEKVIERRVEDLLNAELKWDLREPTKASPAISSPGTPETTSTTRNSGYIRPIAPVTELQRSLQGEWKVSVFQSDGETAGGQAFQVVIRGNVLLMQTVVNGKAIGVYPWKLVWRNPEQPFEVDVIHDPNNNEDALLGRIACDGKSFQIVFGGPKNGDGSLRRPSEICPVENGVYIDCVRANIDQDSSALQNANQMLSKDSTPDLSTSEDPNSKTLTRQYSVGSFVTERFFVGNGSFDTKDAYEKYELEIEQSLQDLVKTVGATCNRPPKFVQVVSGSRSLLIGHSKAGHEEIANFMRDIGINNDRIRLRYAAMAISKDDARSLGIELTQHVISPEEVKKLHEFAKTTIAKSKTVENQGNSPESSIDFLMNELIPSGTRNPIKRNDIPIPLTIAARIVPGAKQIQIRFDMHGMGNGDQYVVPQFKTLSDGQSVLFAVADDLYCFVTADIVREASIAPMDAEKPISKYIPPTPAMEMQQSLQGEWEVKTMGLSADVSDKRPYQAVVRGQLFLLQCMEDGKVIGTSPFKMIWPEADHPDVVDIVWDPNNNSDEYFYKGRVACDGKSFQIAWRSDDTTSGPAIRPTEICSGDGISYFECIRKKPIDPSLVP